MWTLWWRDLPGHPLVKRGVVEEGQNTAEAAVAATSASSDADFLLKVRRPALTNAPIPPLVLMEWLQPGWDKVDGSVTVRPSRILKENTGENNGSNATNEEHEITVFFEDSFERTEALKQWQPLREAWARAEKPVRATFALFERLYELHGHIQREAERVELIVGDGLLRWQRPDGDIHHPILLQRLELEFDPNIPEFTLREANTPVELYTALFSALADVDGQAMGQCREELENSVLPSVLSAEANGFLKRLVVLLSAKGEFQEDGEPKGVAPDPRIGREPVIFLRSRSLGFATALEAIREDIATRKDLPVSLLNIVGEEGELSAPTGLYGSVNEGTISGENDAAGDDFVLMSKPANPEQMQIARRLEAHGCVLVQGPPGTGKTHTIANLLGHLLAQGKTVLVTSHTTKALKVVREKVVEALQPLCVSVLDKDSDSIKQLENSVGAIVEKRSEGNAETFAARANTFETQRHALLQKIRRVEDELLRARGDEYRDVVIGGTAYAPSEAARRVREGAGKHDWIPGPLAFGNPLPLTVNELLDLYSTNKAVTDEDERELSASLPSPDSLLSPLDFAQIVAQRQGLQQEDLAFRQDLWHSAALSQPSDALADLHTNLIRAMELLQTPDRWLFAVIEAGMEGAAARQVWEELIATVETVHAQALEANGQIAQHGPVLAANQSAAEQARVLDEIVTFLESGGKLNSFTLLTHSRWKQAINSMRVGEEPPRLLEHFRALRALAKLTQARKELAGRWERQVTVLGGPGTANMAVPFERACRQLCSLLQNALDWHTSVWHPLQTALQNSGFTWSVFLEETPANLNAHGSLLRLREAVVEELPPVLAAQHNRQQWQRAEKVVEGLSRALSVAGSGSAHVVEHLRQAVRQSDAAAYQSGYERLQDLFHRSAALQKRQALLSRLDKAAPAWCAAIRERHAPHFAPTMPGTDAEAAWLWRQLEQELECRATVSLPALQQEREQLQAQLRDITAHLIEARAWAAQMRRTNLQQRQALEGWLALHRRIGKGTGKRVPKLQAEARKRMQESRAAVPVWIMPLARVVENFHSGTARFDVVIIDEASQCDVMGLIALYMAKTVVIVGDHEQVSPDAVGDKSREVDSLITQYLDGVPNKVLYDGQMSVYDLAKSSFGGTICLTEHFRCVPDIIQFSNHLSYDGKIKPLRDTSQVRLLPPTIAYRVDEARSHRKTNTREAETVASLLIAATEQPEYSDATFGVISLVGDEQARSIDTLLRRYLLTDKYEKHHIVCGNAAHFQGDERTVMFLSVVDASEDGPLAMRQEGARDMFKKRFNVAASRAQDQMWVVHSLQPQTHLKPGDIRRRLIEHAQDPGALSRLMEAKEKQTESEFEVQVLRRLMTAGYQVTPQWKVGHYRIDMVVEGNGRRLAVECDGDCYHPLESLQADMERQAILERLGWTFVRIRGSLFFRDTERAMLPVFARLQALNITPELNPDIQPQEVGDVNELRDRVIRRAAELRAEWNPEENAAVEVLEVTLSAKSRRSANTRAQAEDTMPPVLTEEVEQTNGYGEDLVLVSPTSPLIFDFGSPTFEDDLAGRQ